MLALFVVFNCDKTGHATEQNSDIGLFVVKSRETSEPAVAHQSKFNCPATHDHNK